MSFEVLSSKAIRMALISPQRVCTLESIVIRTQMKIKAIFRQRQKHRVSLSFDAAGFVYIVISQIIENWMKMWDFQN